MSTHATLEAVPAERLQAELTRKVAARLSPAKLPVAGKVLVQSSMSTSSLLRPAPTNRGTDLDVVIDGESYAFQTKSIRLTGRELLEAVHAAAGELLGSAKVFIVHDTDPAVAKVISAIVGQLPEVVARRRLALSERNIEALVDVFLGADPLAAAMPAIESDNATAQATFLERWPVLTAEDIALRAEHGSSNRSATASRWKKARKIFGMRVSGREAYPAFQFREGRPRQVLGKILARLPETLTGWQIAFWFTGPNGWLDGQAPVKRLDDEAVVVAAAEHERDTWMG